MSNTNISFYKGESFTTYETGAVYFETSTHQIKVATSESSADIYCGVRSASLGEDSKLLIVNEEGNTITLDFSDIASASTLSTLLGNVGDVSDLTTTSKTVVGAINELDSEAVSVVNMTETTATISPNKFYIWGEVSELDITLETPANSTVYNEYLFQFTSGNTATTLSLPSGITWFAGNNVISSNKTYQISIVNNLAVLGEF